MTTRRDFLRQTALLGAGLTISPFFIKAGSAGVGANDKIGVGLIGCNGGRDREDHREESKAFI